MASFTAWLAGYQKKQTAIGDFARDWYADQEKPRVRTLKGVLAYLEDCGACDGALEAARRAWAAYSAECAAAPTRYGTGT